MESGSDNDPIREAEAIRDWNFRAVYGAFNAMKNGGGKDKHDKAVLSWIAEEIPKTRMLELARQDPATPYAGGASTFYRFVAKLRAEREAGAAPVIRFEGLPGEYVQWDWGEARVRLGGVMLKRVFLAGRLKYSRLVGIRWRTQMDLETLLRAMLEIVEGWGGVPWAWVFDNMKTVTLGRDAEGQPRWNPAPTRPGPPPCRS